MEQAIDFANTLNKMEKWLSHPGMEPKLHRELAALEDRLVRTPAIRKRKKRFWIVL